MSLEGHIKAKRNLSTANTSSLKKKEEDFQQVQENHIVKNM